MKEFDALIDALRDPELYDHPVSKVEVIETHISGVLLAGDYVYKIKKPVDFGFVDFSTLERRRHYCEEELRLNRRFAPDLYLDVVPIYGEAAAPSFEGGGEPFEYAVKMARFDQNALVDRCIRRAGRITGAMIDAFARDVASVHERAASASPESGHGSPGVIRANLEECWDPIRRAGLLPQDEPSTGELVEGTRRAFERLEPWFQQRLEQGRVRECHGDLHLGNLYLADGVIRAFDCIEFNDALRWIDVANDIAFCTMDLRFHDETGLARRFRNGYLEATGDYPLLGVLRFYEIYRAVVRAKVASLRELEEAGTGARDARMHLDLAGRLLAESPATPLIITYGLSGSGKTYVTSGLLESSEAIRIRSDVERDRCVDPSRDRYSSENIERVYEQLESEATAIVEAGYPVIVDATFLKRARREQFQHLADRLGVPFRILHCSASEPELRRRVAQRAAAGSDASEADLQVLDLQITEMETLGREERANVVSYDTQSPPALDDVLPALGLSQASKAAGAGSA